MRRLRFLVLLFWSLLLFGLALRAFPVPLQGAWGLMRSGAAALLLLLAAATLGRAALARFKLFHGSWVEEAVFSLGLGLLGLSLLGSGLGALGLLHGWALILALGLGFLLFREHLEALADGLRRSLRSKHPWEGNTTEVVTLLALALAGFSVLALALAPPTFYDALVYHLAQAQRTALTGLARPQEAVLFTWLPSLVEPLWSMALALDGDPLASVQAASLLNVAVFLALGLALMDAAARLLSERRLWLAPALGLTQPLLALSFGVFSPDGWMAFFAFLSLNAFLLALAERGLRPQRAWLLLSALLAGAAVAAKPVALGHAGALLALVAALAWREPAQRSVGLLLAGAGLFLLPLLPWLLRGGLLLGQPFYPFSVEVFGWRLGTGAPEAYFRHLQDFGGRQWLRLPYQAFFEPQALGGGGHLSFLLLALCPAALLGGLSRPLRWLGLYLGLGALFWMAGPHVLRYALFLVPGASLLAAHAALEAEVWAVSRTWTKVWRGLVLAGLLAGALQALAVAVKDFDPLPPALGLEKPAAYLARRGVPQARAWAWIKAQGAKPQAKVLVLGDSRTAWLPAGALAASAFEAHPLAAWVAQARDPQDLDARLARKGYDFVFINRAEWARLAAQGQAPVYGPQDDEAARLRFEAWVAHLEALPERRRLVDAGFLVARLR